MRVRNGQWKISTLIERRPYIQAQPSYQRGSVWTKDKRQLLIDSILQQFDIPKIYLRRLAAKEMYDFQVIDGQQRLLSIWSYIDGGPDAFSLLSDDATPVAWRGKTFSKLSARLRKRIENFEVSVAIIESASDTEVRELFARLQRGMQLNQPEMRNSMRSALGTAVRATAETHPFFIESPFSEKRYGYHDLAAHAYAIELNGLASDLKAPNLRELYKKHADRIAATTGRNVHKRLKYLQEMLASSPGCISRKWGFVDLIGAHRSLGSDMPEPSVAAKRYVEFERRRIPNVSNPKVLLNGPRKDRELYDYIEAFRLSAGTSKHLGIRNQVLSRRLKSSRRSR